MRDVSLPKVSKWPFYFADGILLALAVFIFQQGQSPLGKWEILTMAGCVGAGALFAVLPFILDYQAAARAAEAESLTSAVSQVKNVEAVARKITEATGQWQTVNEHANQSRAAAKEIADRMAVEAKQFTEFMQRANDSEKATLRLEVEKLRRAEGDWLQVLVRIFDHAFALHAGAVQSGRQNVIDQITRFVDACRDVARRIGLSPFVAAPEEIFDPIRHQTEDGKMPAADAIVDRTLAAGFTFQGQLLRPALVQLRDNLSAPSVTSAVANADQSQLPLTDANEVAAK